MFSFYGKLSTEVYDLDKPIGFSFGDIEYYQKRLEGVSGKILEPATGTGRVLIPLLEQGFDIDGMDNSPDMLAVFQQNCKDRGISPTVYVQKMQDFHLPTKYEAIVLPAGSFHLISDYNRAMNALHCFYQHLEAGGKLLLDLYLQTSFHTNELSTRTWTTSDDELITMESKIVEIDLVNQRSVSHFRYEKWMNKNLMQIELERYIQKWYGIREFELMLKAVGFKDITISADYQLNTFPTHANQTVTFEAWK